ncbi:protein-disulfide reductase DsbD domain-containing protein [Emcibacter sp.]|uniref:protein-disulfide reductase DsbD domain-containing protein n=1 Tax=Emcibacter sp. TaxID=1979954 RepID=UPI003A90EA6B
MKTIIKIVGCFIVLALCVSSPVFADEPSSAWVKSPYTTSRLFVGGYDAGNNIVHLGWQIRLRDGWKTYWRSPGETGMPPSWNWNNKGRISEISVKWPAPERMTFFGYDSNIYHDEIVIPIDVRLKKDAGEVAIALRVDFMICKDVCIPLDAKYRLHIEDPAALKITPYQSALLQKYSALVPRKAKNGFVDVRDNGKGKLEVRLAGPLQDKPAYRDLFVEGPDEFYFSTPVPVGKGQDVIFEIPYTREREHGTLAGRKITLTLVPVSGPALEAEVGVTGE